MEDSGSARIARRRRNIEGPSSCEDAPSPPGALPDRDCVMSARQRRQMRADEVAAGDDVVPAAAHPSRRERRTQLQQPSAPDAGEAAASSNLEAAEHTASDDVAAQSRSGQRLRQLSARVRRQPVDPEPTGSRRPASAPPAPASDEATPRSLLPRADISAVVRAAVATRLLRRKTPGPDHEMLPPFDKTGLVEGGAEALEQLTGQVR